MRTPTHVVCPHLPDGERWSVAQPAPRGATAVRCPCCNLPGWFDDDDPTPMVCPYCDVDAVPNPTAALADVAPRKDKQ